MATAEEVAAKKSQLREAIELAGSHFVNTVEMGVLKTFIDFKVFDAIPEEGSITLAELGAKVNGTEELLSRFAAFLIAAEILASPVPGSVAHTAKSLRYRSTEIPAGFLVHIFNMLFRPAAQLPTFFERNGLASPSDARVTPMGLAMGHPDMNVYEILDAEPALAAVYNGFVKRAATMFSLKGVYDFGWIKEGACCACGAALTNGAAAAAAARPAVVDIGGNAGIALRDIMDDNPHLPRDRCAVFDLPSVVDRNRTNGVEPGLEDVRLVGGSMLEQPYPEAVRRAQAYQFRRVLNDFPDQQVLLALKAVREAAAPDTRVLIVEEMLKPNPSKFVVAQDITFMCVGGKRRSVDMYTDLAAKAGWKLSKHVQDTVNDCGVLEFVVS